MRQPLITVTQAMWDEKALKINGGLRSGARAVLPISMQNAAAAVSEMH